MGKEAAAQVCNNWKTKTAVCSTDVVIIGNGPSGITLSYLLSGRHPCYNGETHPDEMLQCRLDSLCGHQSLLEEDLEFLSNGLEGRINMPVALLMDALLHPGADSGLDLPSLLNFPYRPENEIAHVVLGKADIGGAWQVMEDDFLTLSLSNWMELADFPFHTWQVKHRKGDEVKPMHGSRIHVREARQYYQDFVETKGLEKFFRPHTTVTSVEKVCQVQHRVDNESGENIAIEADGGSTTLWEVRGYELIPNSIGGMKKMDFCYQAPNVVLATGTYDKPNRLGVSGENSDYVLHSLSELEKVIQSGQLNADSDPLLVVGAGLSAADAILLAKRRGIPVVHSFHRSASDPQIIFGKLPDQLYPEYRRVHEMMKGAGEEGYTPNPKSSLKGFLPGGKVILEGAAHMEREVIKVSYALVLIGTLPQLSFLPNGGKELGTVPNMFIHPKHNPVNVDPYTYQSVNAPGMYALGPLVGESFVRFLQGGSLGVAAHLWKTKIGSL